MFVLMGVFVVRAGLADELFEAANRWLGHMRGGVGMATIAACGGFAALCASSSASAATMAMPAMRRFNYDPGFATGTVAAGGTMGILIPPSSALIIFGLLAEQSIGDLFIAGIIPGVLQIVMYCLVVALVTAMLPGWGPRGKRYPMAERLEALGRVWGVLALFRLIMGGIVTGIITTTEAGGVGAAGAFLFALLRRRMTINVLVALLKEAASISAMIFLVAAGALVLNQFVNRSGLPIAAVRFIESLNVSPIMVIVLLLAFYVVLGCFLDGFAMIFLTVPVFVPIVQSLGFDHHLMGASSWSSWSKSAS
jgi:C4-dicarboxylate transporter DctM subunit